jgi:hypothetical protein
MIHQLKHMLNGLHVYCRLQEFGLPSTISKKIISFYETKIYNRIFRRDRKKCKLNRF